MSITSKFVKFLGKYGDEISGVAAALEAVVIAVPMNKAEKQKIVDTIDKLKEIPDNITAAIKDIEKQPVVRIKFDDIKKAVAELLPNMVAKFFADKAEQEKDQNDGKQQ